jgi:GNAT superfamily N-acetyltransferase
MARKRPAPLALEFVPLTRQRWADLEELFGARGACGGCWCMYWRLKRADFDRGKGEANRDAFRHVVESGPPPGLLAYHDGRPVGWVAVAPRETTPGLDRSRVLKRVDDEPVWSVSCLFVVKGYRRRGVSARLIEAAVHFARERGAAVVEGYPVEPVKDNVPAPFVWTGLASAFRKAGFVEVARRSPTRPVMRHTLRGKRK